MARRRPAGLRNARPPAIVAADLNMVGIMARHRYLLFVTMTALAALPAASAVGQERRAAEARPQLFEALVRCRTIADSAARLSCYDSAAANLQQAAERRDLVVVDRQQVRENRRRLFGLPVPDIGGLFGGDDDGVDHIESTVATAQQGGDGRWVVRLQDGSTWVQTDNLTIAGRPRPGHQVRVERAALGSFRMRVNGQPAVRVRRQF